MPKGVITNETGSAFPCLIFMIGDWIWMTGESSQGTLA